MTLPTGPRALRVTLALYAAIVMAFLGMASSYSQWRLIQRAQGGVAITTAEAAVGDGRHQFILVGQLVVFLVCVVLFLNWLYNSVRNVREIRGGAMTVTPGWAVGYWFIPFVNLVRPYQTMVQLWERSREGISTTLPSPSIGLWWASYLVSGIAGGVASRLGDTTDLEVLLFTTRLEVGSDLLLGVAGFLLIQIIGAIDSAQGAWPDGSDPGVAAF